jgi:Prolipoprotein diacylglyceryl transferase
VSASSLAQLIWTFVPGQFFLNTTPYALWLMALCAALGLALLLYGMHTVARGQPYFAPFAWVLVAALAGALLADMAQYAAGVAHLQKALATPLALLTRLNGVGALLGAMLALRLLQPATLWGTRADALVPALLGAMLLWRFGSFFAGLATDAYGNPTRLPWGINFGDGIGRHPAQLYEVVFLLFYGWILGNMQPQPESGTMSHAPSAQASSSDPSAMDAYGAESGHWLAPGDLFHLLVMGYLTWRFTADFGKPPHHWPTLYTELIRPQAVFWLGRLTATQLLCLVGLLGYVPTWWRIITRLRGPG